MKRLFALLFAMASATFAWAGTAGADVTIGRTHVVDVSKDELPMSIDLHVGDFVVFVRPIKWTGTTVKVTYECAHSAKPGCTAKPFGSAEKGEVTRGGYTTIRTMKVVAPGKGDFHLWYSVKGTHAAPHRERIGFKAVVARVNAEKDTDSKVTFRGCRK